MKEFPTSCNNAFQATVKGGFNIWHWLKVQEVSMYQFCNIGKLYSRVNYDTCIVI